MIWSKCLPLGGSVPSLPGHRLLSSQKSLGEVFSYPSFLFPSSVEPPWWSGNYVNEGKTCFMYWERKFSFSDVYFFQYMSLNFESQCSWETNILKKGGTFWWLTLPCPLHCHIDGSSSFSMSRWPSWFGLSLKIFVVMLQCFFNSLKESFLTLFSVPSRGEVQNVLLNFRLIVSRLEPW